jgi:hypothetical protein
MPNLMQKQSRWKAMKDLVQSLKTATEETDWNVCMNLTLSFDFKQKNNFCLSIMHL